VKVSLDGRLDNVGGSLLKGLLAHHGSNYAARPSVSMDCIDGILTGRTKKARCAELLQKVMQLSAIPVLTYLKVPEICHFHCASRSCKRYCEAPESHKLLTPVLHLAKRHWWRHVEFASVEVLYADDAKIISMAENDEFQQTVNSCTSLYRFYCSYNEHLQPQTLARCLDSQHQLIVLDLSHNKLAVDERGSVSRPQNLKPLFAALPLTLRILDLSYNLLRDEHAFQLLEGLEANIQDGGHCLQQLMMRSNYLGDGAGFALGSLMRGVAGAELWRLDLRTNQVDSAGSCSMLDALKSHPRVQEFRLGYNRANKKQDLQTAGLATLLLQKALSTSSFCRLETLDLNNVRIGDAGIKQMSVALFTNQLLQRLDLAFNSITEIGAEYLAKALERNEYLQQLDLRDNELGDEGAQALAKGLENNNALRTLKIARNDIGPHGAIGLTSAVRGRSKYTKLLVDFGASGVSSAQLQGMMRRTPRMTDLQFMRDSLRDSMATRDTQHVGSNVVEHASVVFGY